jgi:hypothetical protein
VSVSDSRSDSLTNIFTNREHVFIRAERLVAVSVTEIARCLAIRHPRCELIASRVLIDPEFETMDDQSKETSVRRLTDTAVCASSRVAL